MKSVDFLGKVRLAILFYCQCYYLSFHIYIHTYYEPLLFIINRITSQLNIVQIEK